MGNDQLALVTKDLDIESATALRSAFEAMFGQAEEWIQRAKEIRVADETDVRSMKFARECRLGLRDVRIRSADTIGSDEAAQ